MKYAAFLAFAALAACAPKSAGPVAADAAGASWSIKPEGSLNAFFDCLAGTNATLVAAHRGGPSAGFPEDALETMQETLKTAPALMEIDIATSKDGVLYLNHDDNLDRETTGSGPVDASDWKDIAALFLKDDNGSVTPFHPTRFSEALSWADGKTILELDFKKSTRFEDVIAEVHRQHADDRAILIAYTTAQARRLHKLAPDMMISLQLMSQSDMNAAVAAGIPADRIIAFTGIEEPNPHLYSALASDDVEIIFGTLGGRDSIDNRVAQSGDEGFYAELAGMGVDLIATDRPSEAQEALASAGRAVKAGECGVSRGAP